MRVEVALVAAAFDFVIVLRYGGVLKFVVPQGMSRDKATAYARALCTTEEREATRAAFGVPALAEKPGRDAWADTPEVVAEWARR